MKKDEDVKYGQVRRHLIKSEGLRDEEDEWLRAQKLGLSRQAADLMKRMTIFPERIYLDNIALIALDSSIILG